MNGREQEPLRGWRAIADHLGRSTRTVQRWEEQHGLPIAREGDSVVADPAELDRWLRSWARYGALPDGEPPEGELRAAELPHEPAGGLQGTPAPSPLTAARRTDGVAEPPGAGMPQSPAHTTRAPQPTALRANEAEGKGGSRRRRSVVRLGLFLLVMAPVAAGYAWLRGSGEAGQPAAWRIAGRTLFVSDAAGRLLFAHPLGAGSPRPFTHDARYSQKEQWVVFTDLEGDGALEVLVRTPPDGREVGRVRCLEADGRMRFATQASGSRRFGRVEFGEPWYCRSLLPTQSADGARSLWAVFNHHTWFPSRVQQLSPGGELLAEYWSNGHIMSVDEARLGGRDLVLVGATNNEARGASLAILARDGVRGSAPAAKPEYRCEECGEGGPLEFFVFPSSCIWRRGSTGSAVLGTSVSADGRLEVVVSGGQADLAGALDGSRLTYRFSPQLVLEDVRVEMDFVRLHALLFGRGLIDHPLGPADVANLFPVRRWDGSRFLELPRVPVVR